ncbi:membrane protein [Microbacterium phage Barnstormer]|uniref:Membrane protein n=1 Tax=Microbacterium phage Barnstormer TaxID=3028491 RepID=A0AAE9ZK77_9CAUD|nr:membrane protein [Microbacterium phage Barnstormer]WDS52127.1 membrane protein [Microbacterium phage UtzChips]
MAPSVTISEGGVPPSEDAALVSFLTRVEVKLDTVLSGHNDHETRIRALERKVWLVAGAAAVLGGVLGNIAPFISK